MTGRGPRPAPTAAWRPSSSRPRSACCSPRLSPLLRPAVLPFFVLVGVAMPMVVAYQLPPAVASLRAPRRLATAVRRDLAQLPETAHPLDG
jgi:hypothetical protein